MGFASTVPGPSRRVGRARRRWAGLALVAAPLVATACVPGAPPPPPPTVIVYGDSLLTETQAFIAVGLSQKPGWRVVVHQYPGSALCDWLPMMRDSDGALNPHLVILAFSGDVLTPCTQNRGGLQQVWFYDSAAAAELWRSRGVQVLFASTPGDVGTSADPALAGIDSYMANRYGQRYVNAGQVLRAPNGFWPVYLPCAPWEGPAQGCGPPAAPNGLIQVRRSSTNGHLCRVDSGLDPCTVYSSGVVRWGGAIVNAAKPLML